MVEDCKSAEKSVFVLVIMVVVISCLNGYAMIYVCYIIPYLLNISKCCPNNDKVTSALQSLAI